MKKKIILIVALCLSFLFTVSFTGGCGAQNPDSSEITGGDDKVNAYPKDESQSSTQYFTVIFDSNGGSVVPSQTVEKGKKADEPINPARIENISGYDADYVFDGWFYGETKWDFANMTVTKDMTLIARWHNEWAPPV